MRNTLGGPRAMVAAVALSALALSAGCGGDSEADDPSEESTTTVEQVSDEEFSAAAAALVETIEAAGTDFCTVIQAAAEPLQGVPTTPEQVEQVVNLRIAAVEALAATEPIDETNAAALAAGAEKLREAAEEADYSMEFFDDGDADAIFAEDSFKAAAQAYELRAATDCAPQGTDGPAADDPAPEGPAAEDPATTQAPPAPEAQVEPEAPPAPG